MMWSLNYTTHGGYSPPEFRPQFVASLGTSAPARHIEYAAELGMAGFLYPWTVSRPPDEVASVKLAFAETGLKASTTVCMPAEQLRAGLWTRTGSRERALLEAHIRAAAEQARSVGSELLAVIVAGDGNESHRYAALENLSTMAHLASDYGLRLGLEPMKSMSAPFLGSMGKVREFLTDLAEPAVGLIYDTGHITAMGDDPLAVLDLLYEQVALVQFADMPGRVEPGAGQLPLVELATALCARGYDGLVDLEHGWLDESGPDGERDGLARIREFDASVRAAVQASVTGVLPD